MSTWQFGKITLNQFFSLIFIYITDFLTTELEFVFLNTTIILFSLIYALNILHNNVRRLIGLKKTQYQKLFKIDISATFHHTVVSGEIVARK